jgi:tripartite-type tricarboxylate transporter receptor subunit TctC
MVDLLQIIQLVGRSVYMPPGVPHERFAALRAAFDATMKDPQFIARMNQKELDLDPRPGTELQAEIDRVMASAAGTAKAMLAELKLN